MSNKISAICYILKLINNEILDVMVFYLLPIILKCLTYKIIYHFFENVYKEVCYFEYLNASKLNKLSGTSLKH